MKRSDPPSELERSSLDGGEKLMSPTFQRTSENQIATVGEALTELRFSHRRQEGHVPVEADRRRLIHCSPTSTLPV